MDRETQGYQPEQEGKKKPSRRNFLKAVGVLGASLASEMAPEVDEERVQPSTVKQLPDIPESSEANKNEAEALGEILKKEVENYFEVLEKKYGRKSSKEKLDLLTERVFYGLKRSLEKQTESGFVSKAKKYLDNLKENGFQDYYEHITLGAMSGVLLSKGFDKFAEPVPQKEEMKRAAVFANIGAAAGAAIKALSGEDKGRKEYLKKEAVRSVETLINGVGLAKEYPVQNRPFRPDLAHENILKATAALGEFLERELGLKDPVQRYAAAFEILDRQRQ
jgi:hypothetical protein